MDPDEFNVECDNCNERGVGFNDEGEWLCEDCMFEWACEEVMPGVVSGDEAND